MQFLWRFRLLLELLLLLVLGACAEQVAPTGGDKDTRAPQIDSSRYSTPNGSLNFAEEEIILTFDEWITLSDVFNQVIISPPLEEEPEIKVRRRSVVVKFDEKLRDSTTYTINFGTAIQDITENNPQKDFRFVFSTGSFLDSLRLRGKVQLAATGEAATETLVLLYDDFSDSAVHQQKPLYFARTDEGGNFQFYNLRADSFRIFALADKNGNYRYDQDNEAFAFLEEGFRLSDSSQPFVQLRLWETEAPLTFFQENLIDYGQVDLVFNRPPQPLPSWTVLNAPADYREYYRLEENAIKLWFEGSFGDSLILHLKNGQQVDDTLRLQLPERNAALADMDSLALASASGTGAASAEKGRPAAGGTPVDASSNKIPATAPFSLEFNLPLLAFDSSRLQVLDTAGQQVAARFRIDSLQEQLLVEADWQEGLTYRLEALPGGLSDWYGRLSADTLRSQWAIGQAADFGTLTASLKGLEEGLPYLLELSRGEVLKQRIRLVAPDSSHRFENLPPGAYTLRVIEDRNSNGRWDTGNYSARAQPERLIISNKQTIQPGWEGELSLNFREEEAAKPEAGKQ